MKNNDLYGYPPRGMSRIDAARYVGVGTSKFDQMIGNGSMPKPIKIDGRRVWDRRVLDAAFDDLSDQYGSENELDRLLSRAKSQNY